MDQMQIICQKIAVSIVSWNDVWQSILHSATHQELKEKLKSEWSIYFFSKKNVRVFDAAHTTHPSSSHTNYGLPSTGLTNFALKLFNFIHIITIEINANLFLFFHLLIKEVISTR